MPPCAATIAARKREAEENPDVDFCERCKQVKDLSEFEGYDRCARCRKGQSKWQKTARENLVASANDFEKPCTQCWNILPNAAFDVKKSGALLKSCTVCIYKMRLVYHTNAQRRLILYKNSAKQRHIEWQLSDEEVTALFTADRCEYCERPRDEYLLGIDRVVNSNGYVQGNCVSCCARCNLMKSTYSRENFLSRMAIAQNNAPETVGQGLDQFRDQLNNLNL